MHDWSRLSHVRWECKYHVVIVPKYRKKSLYGGLRKQVGEIIRELCRQKGVELLEGHVLGPYPHVFKRSAQTEHRVYNWIFEGQECGANPPGDFEQAPHNGAAFLGAWVLREHSGLG